MTKQEILNECGRRIGDTNATFLSGTLSPAFDFVLLELAQDECISLLRKQSTFAFNAAGCVVTSGILNVATATVLSLAAGRFPERIHRLLVPAFGTPAGTLRKTDDEEFERLWINHGTSYAARPQLWRIFPNMSQLQLWPAPDATSLTATCFLEWLTAPATLADGATITEISLVDIPTILAGLYRVGILFQDETLRDATRAEALWLAGKQTMRARRVRQQFEGRRLRIKYQDV